MGKFKDISGQKFGKLLVIKRIGIDKHKHTTWLCKCDCGNEKIISKTNLIKGDSKSCGCLKIELNKNKLTKHGLSSSKLWGTWNSMKQRCYNPNRPKFKNYGSRGIKICDEWLNDFQAFYEYVSKLEHFGEKGYSLDRINNDGNYEPNNVRWATYKEQANNRRKKVVKNAI